MNKRLSLSALVALLFLALAPQAKAQAEIELGPRVGLEANDIESLVLGGDLRVSTVALPFQISGAFDYYFPDDNDFAGEDPNVFRFTVNGLYELGVTNQVFTPYIGAGVSILRISRDVPDDSNIDDSDSDVGLNIIGGAKFEVANYGFGAVRPFVQAEFVPLGGDIQPFQITGGILFRLGGV